MRTARWCLALLLVLVASCTRLPEEPSAASPSSDIDSKETGSTKPDSAECDFGPAPSSGQIRDLDDQTGWTRDDPSGHGFNPAQVESTLAELDNVGGLYSFLVARNGVLVVERYYNGADATQSREIASASKSVMSALVGVAVDRGDLGGVGQTLETLLPDSFEGATSSAKAGLTMRSLLTMSTGFSYEPVISDRQSAPSDVSVAEILASPLETSTYQFLYNTGAVHLGSAILSRATGMSTCQFAHETLMGPIGVTVDWWNHDRDGVFTGGWNIYLTPREMARFGQLILDDGVFDGRRLVSSAWVAESTAPHQYEVAGPTTHYGYWWWVGEINGLPALSARGGGEQMIYVIPALDIVVVTTSETDRPDSPRFDSAGYLSRFLEASLLE